FWGDCLANVFFNMLNVLVRQLQPRARGSFDIDYKLPRVGAWEKSQAHQRKQAETEEANAEDSCNRRNGTEQAAPHRNIVVHEHSVIAAIKPANKALEPRFSRMVRSFTMRRFDEASAKQRYHCHGYCIRSKKRKHNRSSQSREQEPAHAIKKHHGKENNRRSESGCQHRHGYLAASLFGSDLGRFSQLEMTKDVFQHNH